MHITSIPSRSFVKFQSPSQPPVYGQVFSVSFLCILCTANTIFKYDPASNFLVAIIPDASTLTLPAIPWEIIDEKEAIRYL